MFVMATCQVVTAGLTYVSQNLAVYVSMKTVHF